MKFSNVAVCFALSLVLLVVGCGSDHSGRAPLEPGLHPGSFEGQITKTVFTRYSIYLPPDYGKGEKAWPLVLFLHGSGERGEDLEQLKAQGLPKLLAQGKDFPFIIVSPQCPSEERWDTDMLNALLDEIIATQHVDPDRIYLTGLSMGGFGTWKLAAEHPERFAAVVPICGGGRAAWAPKLAHLPIWTFHGAKDRTVAPERSEEMVMALREYGNAVRFTVYPEAGHDSWTQTYDTPELYEWLLKQKRVDVPKRLPAKVKPPRAPIELELENFNITDADVVDIPGAQGARGVRFDKSSSEAVFTVTLDPRGYEFEVYQYCPDQKHNTVKFRLLCESAPSKILRLSHKNVGKVARAEGIKRLLITAKDSYTLRFYTAQFGVIVDRVVITPLY